MKGNTPAIEASEFDWIDGHFTFQVGSLEIKAGPGTFASIPTDGKDSCWITRVLTEIEGR
jgi:hypothetical protein